MDILLAHEREGAEVNADATKLRWALSLHLGDDRESGKSASADDGHVKQVRVSDADKVLMSMNGLASSPHAMECCTIMDYIFDYASGRLNITIDAQSDDAVAFLKGTIGC